MERPGEEALVKYFMGKADEQEQRLIEMYLAMGIDADYVAACMKEAAQQSDKDTLKSWTAEHQEQAWNKFQQRNQLAAVIPVKKMARWKKVTIAASLILGCSVSGLYFNLHQKNHQVYAKISLPVKTDHAPGANKAVLILADGRKINLNDAKSGALAMQGDTKIIKSADGQLVYNEDADTVVNEVTAMNMLQVPKGGQYTISLPDGTKVWLNAASSLSFPTRFSGNKREVTLTGEAYFEVAKNAAMPFTVKLNKMQVEVLGTHFNIMAYENEPVIRTTLLEGSVKLVNAKGQQLLKPGQDGIMLASNRFVVKAANIEQVMAWKNGTFIFDDEDLAAVSRRLSRWYDISVTDLRKDKSLTYTGAISKYKYVSEVLKMLELTGTMHFKIEDRKVLITNPK